MYVSHLTRWLKLKVWTLSLTVLAKTFLEQSFILPKFTCKNTSMLKHSFSKAVVLSASVKVAKKSRGTHSKNRASAPLNSWNGADVICELCVKSADTRFRCLFRRSGLHTSRPAGSFTPDAQPGFIATCVPLNGWSLRSQEAKWEEKSREPRGEKTHKLNSCL